MLFTVFWLAAFVGLGVWQITRGLAKQEQQEQVAELRPPLTSIRQMSEALNSRSLRDAATELFFQPVKLSGVFRAPHFLLDNSIYYEMRAGASSDADTAGGTKSNHQDDSARASGYAGGTRAGTGGDGNAGDPYCQLYGDCGRRTGSVRVGYRVFSVFVPSEGLQPILVERGWLPAGADRTQLPPVPEVNGAQTITGVIMPETGARRVLRADVLSKEERVQLVQKLDVNRFAAELGLSNLYPFPVILAANSDGALEKFAPLPRLGYLNPARHFSYAAQWFLMAVTLLIVYIVFYRQSQKAKNEPANK